MEESPLLYDPFGLVGKIIERKVRVDRFVAEGGFGVVYRGHHLALDVSVAVKVMRRAPTLGPDEWMDAVDQFLNEAKAIAKLSHPAVVAALDAGVTTIEGFESGVPWMVLEWVEGETLQAHLARRRGSGGRSAKETLALLRPVLEAMAVAHEAGVLHRDLKPSNLMLSMEGTGPRLRVLDFGIAKLAGDAPFAVGSGETTTNTRTRAFSMVCAAPEQLSGTRTGPWTDVYALGLLVTEVLCDIRPYPENDPTGLAQSVFASERPTPKKLGVGVGAWEAVLERALSIKAPMRHANARALLEDLERTVDLATTAVTIREGHARLKPEAPTPRDATTRDDPEVTAPPRRTRARTFGTVAALGAIAIGGGLWARSRAANHEAPVIATRPSCTTNLACSSPGHPAICRKSDGACMALESQDCKVLADDRALASDDTVWIGAMFPQQGKEASELHDLHAVDLARRDFVQTMGGVSAARSFGVLSCDDSVDPKRAATHLAEDVGVPAVIGYRSGVEAIELETAIFAPRGVLSICATSTNPFVTRVPQAAGQPRLAWRTQFDAADDALALAALTAGALVPDLRSRHLLGARELPRIAYVRPKDAAGGATVAAITGALLVDGKTPATDDRLLRDVPYDANAAEDDPAFEVIARDLAALEPHIVLFHAPRGVTAHTLPALEAAWPKDAKHRPIYVNVAVIGASLRAFVGDDADRAHRVFGIAPPSTTPAHARFVSRFAEVFPADGVTRTAAPDTAYDAFYALAYATYATPRDEPITGATLSRAFARLHAPGRAIDVGMVGIFDAYAELSAGRNVDLAGAAGTIDLDPATGDAVMDRSFSCFTSDRQTHALSVIDSGLVYSMEDKKLVGKMKCL